MTDSSCTAWGFVRLKMLTAILLTMAGCTTIETGVMNEKDFCFGVCSYAHHNTAHEPKTIEPVELDISIRHDTSEHLGSQPTEAEAAEMQLRSGVYSTENNDDCGKENPEACF